MSDNVEATRPAAAAAATTTSNNLFEVLRAAVQGGVNRIERSFSSSGSPDEEGSSSNDDGSVSLRRRMLSAEPLSKTGQYDRCTLCTVVEVAGCYMYRVMSVVIAARVPLHDGPLAPNTVLRILSSTELHSR